MNSSDSPTLPDEIAPTDRVGQTIGLKATAGG